MADQPAVIADVEPLDADTAKLRLLVEMGEFSENDARAMLLDGQLSEDTIEFLYLEGLLAGEDILFAYNDWMIVDGIALRKLGVITETDMKLRGEPTAAAFSTLQGPASTKSLVGFPGTDPDLLTPNQVPGNDLCADATATGIGTLAAPVLNVGTTVGSTFDGVGTCGTSNTAIGVWYKLTSASNQTITVSTCPSSLPGATASYDTKLSVFCGPCPTGFCVGGNDDQLGCSPAFRSTFSWCAEAGVEYRVLVHGFGSANGTFTLAVAGNGANCTPTVACVPPPACNDFENEPTCGQESTVVATLDTVNGGCNSTPPVFEDVSCGTIFCGTTRAGQFLVGNSGVRTRDTDWFRLVLTGPTEVTFKGNMSGTGNALFGRIENFGVDSCVGVTAFAQFVTPAANQTGTIVSVLPAGTYYYFAGKSSFFTVNACPTPYTAWWTCVALGACCNDVTQSCELQSSVNCAALGGYYYGDGTDCASSPCVFGGCCESGPASPCSVTSEVACNAGGGLFLGEGQGCNLPGPATTVDSFPGAAIPDSNLAGVNIPINVPAGGNIQDLNIEFWITHTWVGDLEIRLTNPSATTTVVLLDNPVNQGGGCTLNNYNGPVADDQGTGGAWNAQCVTNLASPPNYTPFQPLSAFNGQPMGGTWTLNVRDTVGGDIGTVDELHFYFIAAGPALCDGELGACCIDIAASCTLGPPEDCVARGGTYLGAGSRCGDCQFGACCSCDLETGDQVCAIRAAASCASLGGEHAGGGVPCYDPASQASSVVAPILDPPSPGADSDIVVASGGTIQDLNVRLDITHTWVGDLTVSLTHVDTGTVVQLVNRPVNGGGGCTLDNYRNIIIDDESAMTVDSQCVTNLTSPPTWAPSLGLFGLGLNLFDGEDFAGTWRLHVQDFVGGDVGTLNSWELIPSLAENLNCTPFLTGACCLGENCLVTTQCDCDARGGVYSGDGSTCAACFCCTECDLLNLVAPFLPGGGAVSSTHPCYGTVAPANPSAQCCVSLGTLLPSLPGSPTLSSTHPCARAN